MKLRALLLAFALALGAVAPVSADPAPAEAPAPEDYENSLSPYGNWVDAPDYGRVWQPSVSVGWQPYVDGYWAWTPAGWTWVSAEPWGWTFHYGRWATVSGLGWIWVPGYVYGPAWVDWYWGDGYVGWAPLSPFGVHVALINRFIFVHERDFCSPHLGRAFVRYDRVPREIVRGWRGRIARPPGVDRIERVGRYPVVHVSHDPTQRIVPHRDFDARRDRPSVREPRRDRPFVRPGARDRVQPAERTEHRPPTVTRPGNRPEDRAERRPPVVTTAPIPRGGERAHFPRAPRGDDFRAGATPTPPVVGMRGRDPIAPRPGVVYERQSGRAPVAPPPVVSNGARMYPGAGHVGPGFGGNRPGSMPRHGDRGGGRGHVVPGSR